jgi:probable HAF family extracellular repeat protein
VALGTPAGIRKGLCYFDPCVISKYEAVSYVASVRVTDLGTLSGDASSVARDVNDAGQIVGESVDGKGTPRAVYWPQPSLIHALPIGISSSSARGINSSGAVTGWFTTFSGNQDGFLWNSGGVTDLTWSNPNNVPYWISAERLNDAGTVVGTILTAQPSAVDTVAYWPWGTTVAQVPQIQSGQSSGRAFDINTAGTIAGGIAPWTNVYAESAFVWQPGTGTTKSCAPSPAYDCFATGISDGGQMVGTIIYGTPGGSSWEEAFFMDVSGMHPLGSLWPNQPTAGSFGTDIDEQNLAVGSSWDSTSAGIARRAFLWGADFGMYDLGSIPAKSFLSSSANGTNPHLLADSILVVGFGTTDAGSQHAALWSVTLGLRPVIVIWPGVWGRPFTPIIYENPLYSRIPATTATSRSRSPARETSTRRRSIFRACG